MSAHTPGTWDAVIATPKNPHPQPDRAVYVVAPDAPGVAAGKTRIVAFLGDSEGPLADSTLADAALIAAAPELLAELREADAIIVALSLAIVARLPGSDPVYMRDIRADERAAVLIKATGGAK